MDIEMEAATLVITRAGASTCAELMVCGRPAIMVPMPNSAGNHQVMNAQAMAGDGRAVIVQQNDNLNNNLLTQVSLFVANPDLLFNMAIAVKNKSVIACLEDIKNILN
jgi:UDP-N-acetylglucosamine--N-acetylmuramyl-(pentapeptide) pyrophosphoryl-undecaprenol N-acetylglucosamine transferase